MPEHKEIMFSKSPRRPLISSRCVKCKKETSGGFILIRKDRLERICDGCFYVDFVPDDNFNIVIEEEQCQKK